MNLTHLTNRTFGIEIEAYGVSQRELALAISEAGIECRVEGYNHLTRTWWKVIGDASIHGPQPFELVSPILQGEDGIKQIETVCRVLGEMGAKVNKSCGLHIHHGTDGMTLKDIQNTVRMYVKYESVLDELVPASRRESRHILVKSVLRRHSQAEAFRVISGTTSVEDLFNRFFKGDRYYKLNLASYFRHGTIEFRHHGGTTEFEKIAMWVRLTQAIVECAVKSSGVKLQGADKFENIFKFAKGADLKKFYTERRAQLARAA